MTKIIKRTLQTLASCLMASSVYALENLSEDDLAQTTGQDGITTSFVLPVAGWTADEVVFIDKTGVPSTIKPGFDFHSGSLVAKNVGIKACTEASINGACDTSTGFRGISFEVDKVGGIEPMLNIRAKLFNASKFRIYIDKIALRNGLGGNEGTLIDFNHPDAGNGNKDYFDLLPSGNDLFTVQLGSESSGHMVHFGTTVFNAIDFGEVRITDKLDTGVGGNGRNLRFDLVLANVNLTGAGIDIAADGLVITTPNLTNLDITFNNIAAGSSAVTMGNMGIKGLNLSNHSLTIAGKI